MSELSSRQSGANSKSRPPQYRRMKRGKGRADSAVTYIDGKRVLLGEWKSPESRAKFAELVGDSTSVDTTIAESAVLRKVGVFQAVAPRGTHKRV
jgi:hypothetical protein